MITVRTTNPNNIYQGIIRGIQNGSIDTWKIVTVGNLVYFTHDTTNKQWLNKSYMKAGTDSHGNLIFHVIRNNENSFDQNIFAVYQGRFIQMLVSHFPNSFTELNVTSQPTIDEM